jgi:hypothetical protein
MRRKLSLILLAALLCLSCRAQGTNIYSMMSPKLRQFLADHHRASKSLSEALTEAFTNRTVQLFYFYTDDKSAPRAAHYYPTESSVCIDLCENQEPSDQCICLIFEVLNSEGENEFEKLSEKAQSRAISRGDYAKEMLRQEFQAVKRMKALLQHFRFSKSEIEKSDYYNLFVHCPDSFGGFLSYSKKIFPRRDIMAYYEQVYDSMQAKQQRPNTALEPTATAPSVSTNK